MSLLELEERYKKRIKNAFDGYVGSDIFKSFIKKLNLNDIRFEIATEAHFDEILNLYCNEQVNRQKKDGGIYLLLDLNVKDLKQSLKLKAMHLIKTGRMIVALNKNNKIISSNAIIDLVHNIKSDNNDNYNYNINFKHFLEICHRIEAEMDNNYCKNDGIYQQISNINYDKNSDIKELYGKYCEYTFGSTSSKYSNKGLMLVTINILFNIILHLNYVKIQGIIDNPTQIRKQKKFRMFSAAKLYIYDYSNFVFKNGKSIKDYQRNLKTKYNFNDQDINVIKSNKIVISMTNIVKYKKLFGNDINVLMRAGISMALRSIKKKTNSKM